MYIFGIDFKYKNKKYTHLTCVFTNHHFIASCIIIQHSTFSAYIYINNSYLLIKAPRIKGVNFFTTMLFVGLFPSNILCGNSKSTCSALNPDFCNSARASFSFLPFIKASVCAKKFASKILWCKVSCTCNEKKKLSVIIKQFLYLSNFYHSSLY